MHNMTDWEIAFFPTHDQHGNQAQLLVVKQSFEFDKKGNVMTLSPSLPIVMADEYSGEPLKSGLKNASEVVPYKHGFEFYGTFASYPPKGKQARVVEVNVSLSTGQLDTSKTLRVTGERRWRRSLLGLVASDPKPICRVELNYDVAFGGSAEQHSHSENPIGRGYKLKNKHAHGAILPQVEYQDHVLRKPSHSTPVAGYSPLPNHWQPRLAFQPKIEQEGAATAASLFQAAPAPRYFNAAPQDQIIDQPYGDGWQLHMTGFFCDHDYGNTISVALPYQPLKVKMMTKQKEKRIPLTCDTLVVDSDNMQFSLLWRTLLPMDALNPNNELALMSTEALC